MSYWTHSMKRYIFIKMYFISAGYAFKLSELALLIISCDSLHILLQARVYFPSVFAFMMTLYWSLYLYLLPDEFPSNSIDKMSGSDNF